MIKNEIDFIHKFILHNISLCDTMILVDNGSTDGTRETIEILRDKYPTKIKTYQYDESFSFKAIYLSKLMNEAAEGILIPLDADELLAYEDINGSVTLDPEYIKQYLVNLQALNPKGRFKIKNIYNYIPDSDGWFDKAKPNKLFFLRNDFIAVDTGFHSGITKSNIDINTNIVYLHFHYREKKAWLKSSEQKLRARLGDKWNDVATLLEYKNTNMPSRHIALEYSNYLLTGQWHNLSPYKQIKVNL